MADDSLHTFQVHQFVLNVKKGRTVEKLKKYVEADWSGTVFGHHFERNKSKKRERVAGRHKAVPFKDPEEIQQWVATSFFYVIQL